MFLAEKVWCGVSVPWSWEGLRRKRDISVQIPHTLVLAMAAHIQIPHTLAFLIEYS